MISALAITYNEEVNIEKFITSLSFADEVIIVDSNSTDKTVSLAKELGAKVLLRDFDNFSNQKNFKNRHLFNLKYAPHLGMFKHHAGKDPIDELQFMVDQGFTAFEDNNMKKRDLETQNRIASFMLKNNIKITANNTLINNWKPNKKEK